jgi:hypothetical protein
MLQATVCHSVVFDVLTLGRLSRLCRAEVRVVDALVIVDMIVVLDEDADLPFEIARVSDNVSAARF